MQKRYLLTPGPTPVPENVLLEMAKPVIHHRTPQFMAVLKEAVDGLKYILQTKNDVFLFTSSGTGAMESAVANLLSQSDKAIVVRGGKFGERFTEICQAYGVNAINLDVEWGNAVDSVRIKDLLAKDKSIKAVYVTLCETSTAVVNDIKAIGDIVSKTSAVLVVDVISGLGSVEFKTDEWKVDIAVGGSQKGLMVPPGLAFVSVSEKALAMAKTSKLPKFYFSYEAAKKAADKNDTPWTPALTLVIGLVEAIKMIRQETIEAAIARQRKMAQAIRAAALAMGLELYAPKAASDSVTAIKVPSNIDGAKLVKTMRDVHGVGIAGGQAELKGKIIRIASMGFMTQWDIIVAVSCLEMTLRQMGHNLALGSGVKAAEEIFSR
ncbi:MAG: alanine--glyoxylate aminotransferase family protein [Candidatus Omnitrophica bacterium]|nr:alanine--glyoxylate aminotransferase family protein [Candidatus Omnitrophota bacterium]